MKKESKALSNTKRLVMAAILCALSFIFMYLGTLSGVMDLCAVVGGALCCCFAVIELGSVWPWLVFAVTGVLCLVLLPDKFPALEYIALGGLYPILKAYFERLPRFISLIVKIAVFNLMLTVCLLIAKFILGLPSEEIGFSLAVYVLGNLFFLLFDYALTVFITYYMKKLRHRLKIRL